MKVDSGASAAASITKMQSVTSKRTLQALIRSFRLNNFTNFRPLHDGVCYVISLTSLVPPEVSTFPLLFSVRNMTVSVKIYFSQDKSAHSFADLPSTYNLTEFIEELNSRCEAGRFVVESGKRLIHLHNSISLHKSKDVGKDIVTFANQSVGAFVEQIETLAQLAKGGTPVVQQGGQHNGKTIEFLRTYDTESPPDSETAMLGLKSFPRSLVEVDYDREVQVKLTMKPLSSWDVFAWEAMELDEPSASARFLMPKNCVSFEFFIRHSLTQNVDLLRKVEHIVDTLTADGVMVDDLYDRLYVVDGSSVVVSPVSLSGHLHTSQSGYSQFWGKVASLAQKIVRRQNERLSHSDLWAKLDPLWKVDLGSLRGLTQCGEEFVGLIGTQRVRLVPISCEGTAQAVADRLAAELHSIESQRRYGVTAVEEDGLVCYLVRDV